MWCLFLIVLLFGSGIAVADESNESHRSISETEDSVPSNEAYNDDSQPIINSKEDSDSVEEEQGDLETTSIANYNIDGSYGSVLNNTFPQSVQLHEMLPNRSKTEHVENDSVSTKKMYVDPSQRYEKINDKDGSNVSDKIHLEKDSTMQPVPQLFGTATHKLSEDKDFNPELFSPNQENIFDSSEKDKKAIEYTTKQNSNVNYDGNAAFQNDNFTITTLPSIELDTVADVLKYTSNNAVTSAAIVQSATVAIDLDYNKEYIKKLDSNYNFTTLAPITDNGKYTDTTSSVQLESVANNLTYIQDAASKIYTDLDTTTTTVTKPNVATDELGYTERNVSPTYTGNLEFVTSSLINTNAATDDKVDNDDPNDSFDIKTTAIAKEQTVEDNLESTTASFVTDYSEYTKTGASKAVDLKYTTPSFVKLESVEYTEDDKMPFLTESDADENDMFRNTTASPFDVDGINQTAEEIFDDKSYNFPTTRANSNFRGILEKWLHEQKQKMEQESGGVDEYTTTTDAALNNDKNFMHIQTHNRLKINDSDFLLQEHLKDNTEIPSYSYGRIVDDTDAPCVLLNSTYKIFLNGSQIKLPVQYDTFSNNKDNRQTMILNAGDESGKVNVSIKFNISCTKQYCSITTITVVLRNLSQKTEIISEQKNLNLFQTDYGFASENEKKLTYIMSEGIILEVDHAKFHVIKRCNVEKSLGDSVQSSYYKEIIGGSFAIFVLAALGTYAIIRSNRKKKLVLGS